MTTLGQRLKDEHHALEALYQEVANRVHCGEAALIDASWTTLEAKLLAHLEFEEKHLFAGFEKVDPTETKRLQQEHVEVRRSLTQMGFAIELHTLREEAVGEFLAMLRAHGAREELLLYRWASSSEELIEADTRNQAFAGPC